MEENKKRLIKNLKRLGVGLFLICALLQLCLSIAKSNATPKETPTEQPVKEHVFTKDNVNISTDTNLINERRNNRYRVQQVEIK